MARTTTDAPRPATDVGTLAALLATARALGTRAGLIDDPFAEALVSAVGLDFFTKLATGELTLNDLDDDDEMSSLTDILAVRTRFFDNVLTDACRAGIRQVVILASGLDARPYRLWWPAGTTVYEIDQPRVIDVKTRTLRGLRATPSAHRRAIGIDFGQDWPAALRRVGFDAAEPTVWVAEGLFVGSLAPLDHDRLVDRLAASSALGSWAVADYLAPGQPPLPNREQEWGKRWRRFGYRPDPAGLTDSDEHHDTAESLAALGWTTMVTDLSKLPDPTGPAGLPRPDLNDAPVAGRCVRAVLAQ